MNVSFQETMKKFEEKKEEFYLREVHKKDRDELVQHFVVNSELNMSSGKIAAQVAHVATKITTEICDYYYDHNYGEDRDGFDYISEKFYQWYYNDQPKIILRGKQKDLEKLIEQGWYYIRDIGRTEILEGSLTCVGYSPEWKSAMKPVVKRFQLL